MKKFGVILMIMAILVGLFCILSGCKDKEEAGDSIVYDIKIELNENKLNGEQTVGYNNIYCDELTETVFHLYPNAYASDAENPAYESELASYGGIEINGVSVNGSDANYKLSDNKEYLIVSHEKVNKNDRVSISMKYCVSIPECNLRLGMKNGYYNLSGFYPQLSVYDDGFRTDKFCQIGDVSFSEAATYNINFTCDRSLVVAASVNCINVTNTEDKQILEYKGENVRDFAFACNADYNVISAKAKDVDVYYFYVNDDKSKENLDVAVKALETFSDTFGEYPFSTFSVARVPFKEDGMEYSGIVYISDICLNTEETIIHETAHQWWYGIVGNDCINESYLDEGLTTFSTAYYYELIGESDKYKNKIDGIKRAYMNYESLQKRRKTGENLSMNKPIYDFTEYRYTMVIYNKGCMMFENLYSLYGKEKFNEFLKSYCAENRYKIADKQALSDAACDVFGDVNGLLEGWLGDNVLTTSFA